MRAFFPLLILLAVSAQAAKPKSSLAYQYYSRGVELNSHKKWDEALKQFQSAIDLNPTFVTSYIEFARTSVLLGKRKAALDKLGAAMAVARSKEDKEKVQKERDNLSEIFYTNQTFQQYQNGLNFMRLDRMGQAITSFERALKTEPENLQVLTAYARALRADERNTEAVIVLEKALGLNDGQPEIRMDLAEAALLQQPERSHDLLQPLIGAYPEERAVILQARALSALKRNEEALDLVRDLLEKQPGSLYAPFWLGKLYEKETNGAWNARKYLMTFLRRTEPAALDRKDDPSPEARQLRAARTEAEQILGRVNQSLE